MHDLAEAGDRIVLFDKGPGGDVLDIADLLIGYDAGDNIADFLHLQVSGGNTTLLIDPDGQGAAFSGFQTLCVFQFRTGLDIAQMVTDGNLDVTT